MDALRTLQEKRQRIGGEIRGLVERSDYWNTLDRERFDRLSNDYDKVMESMECEQKDAQRRAIAACIDEDRDRFDVETSVAAGKFQSLADSQISVRTP